MKLSAKQKANNVLKRVISAVEHKLNPGQKIAVGLIVLLLSFVALKSLLKSDNDITASSVMITNLAGTSGGTGIVLQSTKTNSFILTNSHVCGVVENGGMVSGRVGSFMVAGYKRSTVHDLCLIKVEGDLKYNTKVAARPPVAYYEQAMISGHPALMPNVVTTGHFSGRKVIQILVKFRPCTDEDAQDPQGALLCGLVGGMPVIRSYDSTLVTATIMPGSSGSGVYHKDSELSGVAFAGSGDLGYAWTVPYESMMNFLEHEQAKLEYQAPKNEKDALSLIKGQTMPETMKKLKELCSTPDRKKAQDICDLVQSDIVWIK